MAPTRPAKLLALSVSLPRDVVVRGETVRTGIFKSPVTGRRSVSSTQIDGDGQADLSVHGGPEKAVYAYASEHYATWRKELGVELATWGAFGENLTLTGLLESDVRIGDRFAIGSTELIVTQPRLPCYKLGIRFDSPDMVRRFARADRSGFYMAVEREGDIGAGDDVVRLSRDPRDLTVAAVYRLKVDGGSRSLMELAADHPALPAGWRASFRRKLIALDEDA